MFVIRDLQALRDLGEKPSVDEFRRYLHAIKHATLVILSGRWWTSGQRLLRNPADDFRVLREMQAEWNPEPYAIAERIIEREGLSPSVADRIEAVLRQRLHELVVAADHGSREDYLGAYRRMRSSLVTVKRLRRTHLGVEL